MGISPQRLDLQDKLSQKSTHYIMPDGRSQSKRGIDPPFRRAYRRRPPSPQPSPLAQPSPLSGKRTSHQTNETVLQLWLHAAFGSILPQEQLIWHTYCKEGAKTLSQTTQCRIGPFPRVCRRRLPSQPPGNGLRIRHRTTHSKASVWMLVANPAIQSYNIHCLTGAFFLVWLCTFVGAGAGAIRAGVGVGAACELEEKPLSRFAQGLGPLPPNV